MASSNVRTSVCHDYGTPEHCVAFRAERERERERERENVFRMTHLFSEKACFFLVYHVQSLSALAIRPFACLAQRIESPPHTLKFPMPIKLLVTTSSLFLASSSY